MPIKNRPTEDDLQEKALYDILQYLPLDEVELKDGYSVSYCISIIERDKNLSESAQKAIAENLPAIEAILKDRPELGEAKISNMSWQDNDGDGNQDHNPKGMQACTFERNDQVYISFRGTPAKSWIDNAKAFVEDLEKSEVFLNIFKLTTGGTNLAPVAILDGVKETIGRDKVMPWDALRLGVEGKISSLLTKEENVSKEKINGIFDGELKKYTSPMQEEALDYMESLKKSGVFEKYDNVYVTGHSKGGNEATLVTMVYSDVIDRCISGDGQGFSPEFVEYMKRTLGPEEFAKIQDKMYGFHANNDYVNVLGVSVIKVENRIYFVPEIKQKKITDLFLNHLPTAMIDVKTGKIAQVSEQGAFGKFIAKVSEKTAAIILEPIQGESGLESATSEFMEAIKELSEKYNTLVIFDEIQCGMGRTGKLFAYENFDLVPDIVTIAKSLGGGVPIGTCLTKGKANDVLVPGDHGSTYGGNPLVCAVANAVLHELIDNKLIEKNVVEKGQYSVEKLEKLKKKFDFIEEIRGKGLLLGIKFDEKKVLAKDVVLKALENGLLLVGAGNNVVRFFPPFNVTDGEIDKAVSILEKVLETF